MQEGMECFDCPVFFTHTSFTNDLKTIGRIPFRLLMVQMDCGAHLVCIGDATVSTQALYEFGQEKNLNQYMLEKVIS